MPRLEPLHAVNIGPCHRYMSPAVLRSSELIATPNRYDTLSSNNEPVLMIVNLTKACWWTSSAQCNYKGEFCRDSVDGTLTQCSMQQCHRLASFCSGAYCKIVAANMKADSTKALLHGFLISSPCCFLSVRLSYAHSSYF
eukprot:4500761-Amphidinium_carterae.1